MARHGVTRIQRNSAILILNTFTHQSQVPSYLFQFLFLSHIALVVYLVYGWIKLWFSTRKARRTHTISKIKEKCHDLHMRVWFSEIVDKRLANLCFYFITSLPRRLSRLVTRWGATLEKPKNVCLGGQFITLFHTIIRCTLWFFFYLRTLFKLYLRCSWLFFFHFNLQHTYNQLFSLS